MNSTEQEKKPLSYFIGENPLRIIEWPIWTALLLAGLYLLTPAFVPAEGTNGNLAATVGSFWAFKFYAGVVFTTGTLGVAGLVFKKPKLRKIAGYTIFFTFLYFTILRIIIMGPMNLGWITYAINTLTAAAIILRLKWEALTDGTPD